MINKSIEWIQNVYENTWGFDALVWKKEEKEKTGKLSWIICVSTFNVSNVLGKKRKKTHLWNN